MKRKIGKVLISNEIIIKSQIEELAYILKDLVIVRAEQIFFKDAVEYYALCDKFEEVDSEDNIPEYKIIINTESKEVRYVKES